MEILQKSLPGRLELPTLRLTASRSNQLSYGSARKRNPLLTMYAKCSRCQKSQFSRTGAARFCAQMGALRQRAAASTLARQAGVGARNRARNFTARARADARPSGRCSRSQPRSQRDGARDGCARAARAKFALRLPWPPPGPPVRLHTPVAAAVAGRGVLHKKTATKRRHVTGFEPLAFRTIQVHTFSAFWL